MDRLLDVVAGDLYFTTLYRCLRYSGRRIGEIYGTIRNKKLVGGIKVKDINFEEDQIIAYILKTKKTKNKVICPICNVRNIITNAFCSKCGNKLPNIDLESLKYSEPKKAIISIQPEYKDILKLYISKNKLTSNDYIFREKSLSYLKKKVKKDASKAGIDKNFSLHGFRHYFITRCKLAGLSNDQIALWTGHVRPETINIYTHITPQDVISKIRMVDL